MKLRTTLFLLLVCAIFGGYLYLVENKLPTTDELTEQSKLVFNLESDKIEKLQFLEAEGAPIVCERKSDSGEWRITQPLNAKADTQVIQSILRELESLEKSRDLGKVQSAEYGLQPAQTQVQLWIKGKSQSLLLGNPTAVGDQLYVADTKGDVFLVNKNAADVFRKTVSDLRDKVLLDAEIAHATELLVKNNNNVVVHCKKEKEGTWQITEPAIHRGDPTQIERLIRDCTNLRAVDFIAEENTDLVSLGLEPPAGEILLWIEGVSEPQRLLIGKNPEGKQEFYAKLGNRPNIVLVSAHVKDIFEKKIIVLRDKRLLPFDPETLERLEISQSLQTWQFGKKEGRWELIQPTGEVEEEKIENAVKQLSLFSFLQLAEGVQESEIFPSDQTYTLKGWTKESESAWILTIGIKLPSSEEYYAKVPNSSNEIFHLSSGQIQNVLSLIPQTSEKPSP